MKLLTSVLCLLLLYDQQLCSLMLETSEETEDNDSELSGPLPVGGGAQPRPLIVQNSPRFVVRLPDNNLLCFSVEGFELFTYNLITSNYLVINGFLNVTTLSQDDGDMDPSLIRGFTDVGVYIKSVESRSKGGTRMFKHSVYGSKEKVVLERFGEVDMHRGAIGFTLEEGHSNIESENSKHEQFRVVMDKPKCDIRMISGDGRTFSVYVEDLSGLVGINTHGLIGRLEKILFMFTHLMYHIHTHICRSILKLDSEN